MFASGLLCLLLAPAPEQNSDTLVLAKLVGQEEVLKSRFEGQFSRLRDLGEQLAIMQEEPLPGDDKQRALLGRRLDVQLRVLGEIGQECQSIAKSYEIIVGQIKEAKVNENMIRKVESIRQSLEKLREDLADVHKGLETLRGLVPEGKAQRPAFKQSFEKLQKTIEHGTSMQDALDRLDQINQLIRALHQIEEEQKKTLGK